MSRYELSQIGNWARVRPTVLRAGAVAMVVTAAMWAFALGVDVSDRPGVASAGLLTRVYYTSGLFVLGGLDLGVPVGGSSFGRGILWFAYFGAPAITGLAVVEGIFRTVSPERFRLRRVRDHLVVVGSGGLSEIYLERLAQLEAFRTVVLVVPENATLPAIPAHTRVVRVRGEVRSQAVLSSLRLEYAARVLLVMEDAFDNLDAAATLLAAEPSLGKRLIVHVGDLSLLHSVGETRVGRECTIFNSHHVAAQHLVRSALLSWFEHTAEDDMVILGGFGRFGQTVLSELQDHAGKRFDTVIVVDPNADYLAELFDAQVGFARDDYAYHLINDDISCPRVWKTLESDFSLSKRQPAFVFGTSDAGTNLRASLQVAHTFQKARVVARVFGRSAFADDLAKDTDVVIISVAELVKDSMPSKWFGHAKRRLF